MISRRGVLIGAPAIVRSESLMRIWVPAPPLFAFRSISSLVHLEPVLHEGAFVSFEEDLLRHLAIAIGVPVRMLKGRI